ncbi:MAG: hypothetical protein IKE28_03525 [Solobacterium sp.]|nr:hypothetical protein [Solobacterium sp.]
MKEKEIKDITVIVNDENSLYVPYSPESIFSEGIKSYIRSKTTEANSGNGIRLIVKSPSDMDEAKFRTAVKNWIREEGTLFTREEKITSRTLISMLVAASLFIVLSIYLSKYSNVFSSTIIPVLGSVALGRAAGIFVMDMPVNKAKKYFLKELEENSTVVFECTSA